jgi:signal transduction histidine kinase
MTVDQRSILQTIQKNSRFMVSLINDLLDVQKIESGRLELRPEKSQLEQLVEQVIHMMRFAAERKHITLAYQHQEGLPSLQLDPARIEQVVSNLLDNAIKYSYPHSTVSVLVQYDDREATVSVSDAGVGIPPDEMEKLFTPFGRTSVRATGGEKSTGLGLAIAKKIVVQHGGSIWAKRQPDGGTTFTFSIPRKRQLVTATVA